MNSDNVERRLQELRQSEGNEMSESCQTDTRTLRVKMRVHFQMQRVLCMLTKCGKQSRIDKS